MCGGAQAQDVKLETDALLREVPTSTPQLMQQAYARHAGQAPQLLAELATRLRPEKGDEDTTSRFAIKGLIWHVGKYGNKSARKAVGKSVLSAIPEAKGDNAKRFLLEQLQYTSDPAFADQIAKYLPEEPLAHQALRTLIVTAPPDLAKRLTIALPSVDRRTQVAILQALAQLKPDSGASEIAPFAAKDDSEIRAAALDAIAAIGEPESRKLLQESNNSTQGFYGGLAVSRYLAYADRLHSRGESRLAAEICRELITARDTTGTAHSKSNALRSLVNIEGVKALPGLMKAADSEIEEVRMPALRLASRMKDPQATKALVKKLKTAPAPQVAADVVVVLGESRATEALPAVLEALKSDDTAVRVAAVRALGAIDRATALPVLVQSLQSDNPAVIAAVSEQLARAPQKGLGKRLLAGLDGASSAGKVVLVEVLGNRRLTAQKTSVYELTKSGEATVRSAAYKALETLAEADDLQRLLDMMLAAEKGADKAAARRAFVATARTVADKQQPSALLLEHYGKAQALQKPALLETIAAFSSPATLDTVVAEASTSATPELQDAALRALSDWQTTIAIPALINVLKSDPEEKHQVFALRGIVRLAGQSKEAPREKITLLETALKSAKRPEEIRLAVAALGEIQSMAALKLVAPFLNTEGVKAESAAAAAKIALPGGKRKKGIAGAEAASILTQALPAIADEKLRKEVELHINAIQLGIAKKELPNDEEGFSPLFNGKDLSGWVGETKGYRAEAGSLICLKEGTGKLMTEKQFGDFTIRFDFKLKPGGNNGLGIRAPLEGDAAFEGMEVQIIDDTANPDLKPWQVHGSIYGVVPAEKTPLKPFGEWNSQEVTARGNHMKVVVNGTTVVDTTLDEAMTSGTPDGRDHPGVKRNSGHIGFLGHGGHRLEFRNIRIKQLGNEPPEGYAALFNGKDLSGWKGLVGDPLKRAKMTPQELSAGQQKADTDMLEHWSARDGILVFDGTGTHLCTAKDYGNFELLADWKIGPGGDSGIYLRGTPQVQIWDPRNHPEGSGGLYNNQQHTSTPLTVADNPVGQWNHFRIKMEGDRVTVDLNGKRVVDNVIQENYWDRAQPIFPAGQIELQTHGWPVYWRNIFLKELP